MGSANIYLSNTLSLDFHGSSEILRIAATACVVINETSSFIFDQVSISLRTQSTIWTTFSCFFGCLALWIVRNHIFIKCFGRLFISQFETLTLSEQGPCRERAVAVYVEHILKTSGRFLIFLSVEGCFRISIQCFKVCLVLGI